jgi:P4 family phage/plasmid primase-like protien
MASKADAALAGDQGGGDIGVAVLSSVNYTPSAGIGQDTAAQDLLAHLHRGGRWAYWWTNPGKRSTWWEVGDPAPIPQGDINVYFGVHPTNKAKDTNHRATIGDVAAISCLFAEMDAKDFAGGKAGALDHVLALDPPPSVVVDSGGGYHCYWLLTEPYALTTATKRKRAQAVQRRWVSLTGGDPGAKDLARVLRVPGTHNLKYGDRPEVAVILADCSRLYDLDDLEALLPEETPAPSPKRQDKGDGKSSWAEAALTNELAELARSPEGERNDRLNRAAFALGQIVGGGHLDQGEVERALTATGLGIGLEERETVATVRSGIEAGIAQPRGPKDKMPAPSRKASPGIKRENLTDLGNARRLVAKYGQELRYCHPWKRWLVWDGKRWAEDNTGATMRRAKATVREIYAEASTVADEDHRKAIAKHAMRSEGAQRLKAMMTLAESELGVPVLPRMLDRDPWQLNVQNGIIDLRTGELLEHDPKEHIAKLAPVDYDPAAICPLWERFLDEIMDGNADLIHFLQRATGYSLTGNTSEQCLFILYGTGANGKTTLMQTISAMLGEYGLQTPVDTLMVRRGHVIPNDVARLRGARFVTAAEAEEGQRLAESLVKQMTGQDKLAARFLNAEFFEFTPTFKIFLATNHKPAIRGTDHAIWRRIRLIPFNITIPQKEQDRELGTKLLAELDGILAWAVRGCLDWQRDGLGTPAEVVQATSAYRDESDIVGRFLSDCCVYDDEAMTRAGRLYKAYQSWCDDNGERPMTGTMFGRRLGDRGLDKVKTTHVFYLGVGLLADQEEEIPH